MNKSVCVVMSVYNGEKYLADQIDSILAQKDVQVFLFIRDDGSDNPTAKLLQNYNSKYDNVAVQTGPNLGIKDSFLTALNAAPFITDYYAFSDGDDMWLPEKLMAAVAILDTKDASISQGYCSQITLVDSQLKFLRLGQPLNRPISFGNALVECRMSGATAVFNRTAWENIVGLDFTVAVMHDAWVNLVISATGQVHFDPHSHILYRQHQGNADGGTKNLGRLWRDRLNRFQTMQKYSAQASSLANQYPVFLDDSYPDMCGKVVNMYRSIKDRLYFLAEKRIYCQTMTRKLFCALAIGKRHI